MRAQTQRPANFKRPGLLNRHVVPRIRTGRAIHKVIAQQDAVVRLKLQRKINYGESHKVVGSHDAFGNWNVDSAPTMVWNDGDLWTLEVKVPAGVDIDFKCVKVSKSGTEWESGDNRKIKVDSSNGTCDVVCEWSSTSVTKVKSAKDGGRSKDTNKAAAADASSGQAASTDGKDGAPAAVVDRLPTSEWKGRGVEFMRSNQHTRERSGSWDTDGLQGSARYVVAGDEKAGSWLQKLELVKSMLVDQFPMAQHPGLENLAASYVYLQWINTGMIPCVESGGHFRPNRHAELAMEIFKVLERCVGGHDKNAALVARKLHSRIPSFSAEYRASTPLTRIRDIAHRNDIPKQLKDEIKHTLQNKLHRNAGPEDLVAAETMLARLLDENPRENYSESFLQEFKVFVRELQDFFNAGGIRELLESLQPSLDDAGVTVMQSFLQAKDKLDASSQLEDMNVIMDVFHRLTGARALLGAGLGSGLRNDAPDYSLSMRQRWRLAEIRLEEYSFVLLSRLVNQLEAQGGASYLGKSNDTHWGLPLGATLLAVRQLGLDGWSTEECMALENEITAWQKVGQLQSRENALRLKATLERVQRLTQRYCDTLLSIFPPITNQMGRALGIPDHAVKVFTESEVRASMVFQLSRLNTVLLGATRVASGAPDWDTIVAGTVVGRLKEVDSVDPVHLAGLQEDTILLVKDASGDEEVSASSSHLKGIVLCRELPHLSHLGVRARQEKVPFASCTDPDYVREKVRPLVGKTVVLAASAEGASLSEARGAVAQAHRASNGNGNGSVAAGNGSLKTSVAPAPVNKVTSPVLFGMMDSTPANCGAKAASCARLEQVSSSQDTPRPFFRTPRGCTVPFGVMELAVTAAGQRPQFDRLLAAVEVADLENNQLQELCDELQQLVSSVRPPQDLLNKIRDSFDTSGPLFVRSSSNVEDLAGMSGAGLYDSIPNVPSEDTERLGAAIAQVWASLYTRRAILARRSAGVAQTEAVMAVLIQEMLAPDISFILHTASPIDRNPRVLYAELAVGMGETLASGASGSPWRLLVNKDTAEVIPLAFANFSTALVPSSQTVRGVGQSPSPGAVVSAPTATAVELSAPAATHMELMLRTVDYSRQDLSIDEQKRSGAGRLLVAVGRVLEEEFGGPQDVEGCIADGTVYVVQSRPQP